MMRLRPSRPKLLSLWVSQALREVAYYSLTPIHVLYASTVYSKDGLKLLQEKEVIAVYNIIRYHHPVSSSRIIIPYHHPVSSYHIIIPYHHPVSSSRIIISYHYPVSSSRIIISYHHLISLSRIIIPYFHLV